MLVLVVSPSSGVYRTHFGFWQVPSSRRYCRQRKHRFLHFSLIVLLLSLRVVVCVEALELRLERRLCVRIFGHDGRDVCHQDLVLRAFVSRVEFIEGSRFLFLFRKHRFFAAEFSDLRLQRVDAVAGRLALGDEFVGAVGIRLGVDARFVDTRYFVVGDFRPRVRKGASQVGDFLLFLSDLFPRGVCRACCLFCCFSHAFSLL